MKKLMRFGGLFLTLLTSVLLFAERSQATPVVFTVDNTQSVITLSGNLAGQTIAAQGPGSLTATNTGTINADVTGSTIQFTGSSQIITETNGTWQPAVGGGAGSAPADFGGKAVSAVTAYAALRNVVLDVKSPALSLSGTNFDPSQLTFSFVTNANPKLDYNASFAGSGSKPLSGLATNDVLNGSSLTTNGSVITLLIKVNTTFTLSALSPNDSAITLTGRIAATAAVPATLVINALVITNQNLVLTVQGATSQSQLQSSTNLTGWQPATANVSSNGHLTLFTVPITGTNKFFRVRQ